ncbi:MAG: hypothetical protein ACRYGM_05295 [Janthinobacterium lividum]
MQRDAWVHPITFRLWSADVSLLTDKDTDPSPITSETVLGWFRETTKKRDLPDETTCEVFAQMLQNWRAGGLRHDVAARSRWLHVQQSPQAEKDRAAWDKAVGVLKAQIRRRRQAVENGSPAAASMLLTMSNLEAALQNADGWFGRLGKEETGIVWHDVARTILGFYQQAFSFNGPKPGISSPNGPAVLFTKRALDRLGFTEATAAAIAEQGRDQSRITQTGLREV